jgi:hypothetical protein
MITEEIVSWHEFHERLRSRCPQQEFLVSKMGIDQIGANMRVDEQVASASAFLFSADPQVTVEDPPEVNGWSRRSFWVKALEAARRHDSWVRVHRLYTEKTASQIASDLRSAHRRTDNNVRVRGVLPGERWDARWGASPDGPSGQYAIWVRYLGLIDDAVSTPNRTKGAKSSSKR